MASDVQKSPLVKELASSHRSTREKALESLRCYLSSNRHFTDLDLLKLWKGLFFSLWHTPPPHASQRLCTSLSSLLAPLAPILFTRFISAFWNTIIVNYTSIPALRLDKYLLLIRYYIRDSFTYLKSCDWYVGLVNAFVHIMKGDWKEVKGDLGPLSSGNGRVPDGIRYHVLDVWVDELERVAGDDGVGVVVAEWLMEPVRRLEDEGRTKVVRGRAKEVLEDERVKGWLEAEELSESGDEAGEEMSEGEGKGGDEEWNGFED